MDPLPKKSLDQMIDAWLAPARRQENAWLVWVPRSDRARRVEQMLSVSRKIPIVRVSLSGDRIEDAQDWERFVSKSWDRIHPVLFCIEDAEILLHDRPWLLTTFSQFYLQHPECCFLFCSEQYPYGLNQPDLTQNILFQAVYSGEESLHFCNFISEKFDLKISLRERKEILRACGGFLWLIKHLYRLRAQMPLAEALVHPTLRWRLDQVVRGCSDAEREILIQISRGVIPTESETLDVLKALGMTDGRNIHSSLLAQYIAQKNQSTIRIQLVGEQLHLGTFNLFELLGKKTHDHLFNLWKRSGKTISREEMAELLGLTVDGTYSDWTLDQTVSRLRKTLLKVGIPKGSIRTQKGRGYAIQFL